MFILNFFLNNYLEFYYSLCNNLKVVNFFREEYLKGYCIYVFDLDCCEKEGMFFFIRKGYIRIELKFNILLSEIVILLLYVKFLFCLFIDVVCNVNVK